MPRISSPSLGSSSSPSTMTLLLAALLLSLAAPAPAPAPAPVQASGAGVQDTTPRVLLKLEDDWAVALTRRDVRVFERLLAEGFIYTENDRTMDRAAVLHDVAAGVDTVTAAHNEDMKVHQFGTTAIVTGWLVVSGRGTGGPFRRRYRFTDTWARHGARWQIVAAHDYLVPAKAP